MRALVEFFRYNGVSDYWAIPAAIGTICVIVVLAITLLFWAARFFKPKVVQQENPMLSTSKSVTLVQRSLDAGRLGNWNPAYEYWYLQGRPSRAEIDVSSYAGNDNRKRDAELALDGLFQHISQRESMPSAVSMRPRVSHNDDGRPHATAIEVS